MADLEADFAPAASCLNFPVNVQSLPPKGLALTLEANAAERAALAKAHGLAAVFSFSAALRVRPWKKRGVQLEGQIKAEIEQQCVITAEPLRNKINRDFEAYFIPEDSRLARPEAAAAELFLDPEGGDAPETFSGGTINAGAVAEEFFELAIDLYPRRPGAHLAEVWQGEEAADAADSAGEDKPKSPFAALEKLRRPQ